MIAFDHPQVLFLIPILFLLLYALGRISRAGLSLSRRRWLWIVRGMMITALLGALASPHVTTHTAAGRLTVFCIDISESLPSEAVEKALDAVEKSSQKISAPDMSALVVFAGEAQVIRPPSTGPIRCVPGERSKILYRRTLDALRRKREEGQISPFAHENEIQSLQQWIRSMRIARTRWEPLARAAESLCSSMTENTVTVFTDGFFSDQETFSGSGRARMIFVPMEFPELPEVVADRLIVPQAIQTGESFDGRLLLRGNVRTSVTVEVALDGVVTPSYAKRVTLDSVQKEIEIPNLRFRDPAGQDASSGVHTIQTLIYPDQDTEKRNNVVWTQVTVLGRSKVFVLEGPNTSGASHIEQLLKIQNFDVHRETVSARADALDRIYDYNAAVLVDVDPGQLSGRSADVLRKYVHDYGGGLVAVCGSSLERWRSYATTRFGELLPVQFEEEAALPYQPPQKSESLPQGKSELKPVKAPVVSLLLLIDKSGSMAGNNLTLAKEACLAAAETLSPQDQIGVIAFDVKATTVLDFISPTEKATIEDRVLRIFADGGTHLYPALQQAHEALRQSTGSVKHVIVLTDGITPSADFSSLVEQMARDGITVSTVCVGSGDFDSALLLRISNLGHGRFLFTDRFENVPKIFTQETRQVMQEARGNEPKEETPAPATRPDPQTSEPEHSFPVRLKDPNDMVKGIVPSFPVLNGYRRSTAKAMAQSVLVTEADRPVLATWRYGLGHTAVWTSDLSSPWAPRWASWESLPKFFSQVVRSVVIRQDPLYSRITVDRKGDEILVDFRHDGAKKIQQINGAVVSPNPQAVVFQPVRSDVYQARLAPENPDVYRLSITVVYDDQSVASCQISVPYSYPDEWAHRGIHADFFERLPSGSVVKPDGLPVVPEGPRKMIDESLSLAFILWIMAMVLLPVDVALQLWK